MKITDKDRIDFFQRQLQRKDIEKTIIVLSSWWSNDIAPDGYAVTINEPDVNLMEHKDLRTAIDFEMEREEGVN
jgi:hypothetical protein